MNPVDHFSLSQRLVCVAVLKRYSSAADVFNFSAFQIDFEKQMNLPHIPKMLFEAKLNTIDAIFEILKQKHCFDAGVQVRRLSTAEFSIEFDRRIDRNLIWPDDFSLSQFLASALAAAHCRSLLPRFCIHDVARVEERGFETNGWHFYSANYPKSSSLKVYVRLLK